MSLTRIDPHAHAFALDEYSRYSPGETHVPMFLEMAGIDPAKPFKGSVLDAGTGSGKGAVALAEAGFRVTACDRDDYRIDEAKALTIDFRGGVDLRRDLRPLGFHDYVYCCDVMEHLDERDTMLAINNMVAIARRGLFLSISFTQDRFGYRIGEPLHRTVKGYTWWRDAMQALWCVQESRHLMGTGVFLVTPR